ncbi:MAG: hypothetical protein M3R27_15730 [Bacteroidota bacterium]|nr:hypothetical protein [Bacteroidota bacterium]
MLKYAALLFNTVALLIYQFFFADGITVTQKVPSKVKADSEFTVELTINKGTIGGFAKLQQDLPEGFTAVQEDNNGASFTFSNQSVKFIWMSLPSDKEFKIKYKVKVAAGINGDKTIGGKFSYVSDNVKQAVEITPATITVGDGSQPVATTTPETTTTTTDNTNTTTPTNTDKTPDPVVTTEPTTTTTPVTAGTTEPSSVTCKRNVPASPGSEFIVEILINKGTTTGFAKLLETLPAGFTATAMESQGGSFSFSEQKVKFVWVSMPSQPEFKISYKVSVVGSVIGNIDGVFSYIENDETKKFILPTSVISTGTSTMANNTTTNTTTSDNTSGTNNNSTNNSTTNTNTNNTTANNTTTDNSTQLAANNIPAPQGKVNYKVQIMALRNSVDANVLATRYGFNERINTEMAEGLTKYTVGSHNEYKSARDSRETIKNKGVVAPFVTAYNSGKRITVQEALMITSQKWFR